MKESQKKKKKKILGILLENTLKRKLTTMGNSDYSVKRYFRLGVQNGEIFCSTICE